MAARRILSVSSNLNVLSTRNGILRRAGHKVFSARTAQQAGTLLRNATFDLVIISDSLEDEAARDALKDVPRSVSVLLVDSAADPTGMLEAISMSERFPNDEQANTKRIQ